MTPIDAVQPTRRGRRARVTSNQRVTHSQDEYRPKPMLLRDVLDADSIDKTRSYCRNVVSWQVTEMD